MKRASGDQMAAALARGGRIAGTRNTRKINDSDRQVQTFVPVQNRERRPKLSRRRGLTAS
jgi:hypothetical protein